MLFDHVGHLEVADMICFTEQQKQEIVHTGMLVIEFKRLLIRACDSMIKIFEFAKDILAFVKDFWLQISGPTVAAKGKHKTVRRLDKCGFTEKEINLMIGGAYHCRNNC